jgi:hypothetical protein
LGNCRTPASARLSSRLMTTAERRSDVCCFEVISSNSYHDARENPRFARFVGRRFRKRFSCRPNGMTHIPANLSQIARAKIRG